MEHIGMNRRMIIWIVCTLMAMIGAVKVFAFPPRDTSYFFYLFLFGAGFVILIINEAIFEIRKSHLEIERDATIKAEHENQSQSTVVLAICPNCKTRIPADAKYCLQCGEDLQKQGL